MKYRSSHENNAFISKFILFFLLLIGLSTAITLIKTPHIADTRNFAAENIVEGDMNNYPKPAGNHIKTSLLISNAFRGEYSPDGSQILFVRPNPDSGFNLYTSKSDGSDINCLTCNIEQFRGLDVGGGSWHPSGQFITFTAEKPTHVEHPGSDALTHPGIGWYSDIYVMRLSDKKILQVTNMATKMRLIDAKPFTAVLHPHFSNSGNKLSWGQSPDMTLSGWLGWEIAIADFSYNSNNFFVANINTFKPNNANAYYESDDFSSDDSKILLSGNLEPSQDPLSMDLYEYSLNNSSLKRLTATKDWDETPIYSKDNSRIAWLSSQGLTWNTADSKYWWKSGKTEFWIMNSDGSNQYQITFFNTPGTRDYDLIGGRRAIAHYIEWHPNGHQLLGSVSLSREPRTGFEENIYLIELD